MPLIDIEFEAKVAEIHGDAKQEENELREAMVGSWSLVSVVDAGMCRKAYLQRAKLADKRSPPINDDDGGRTAD